MKLEIEITEDEIRSAIKMRRFKIKDRALTDEPGAFADPVLALAVSGSWRRAA